MRESWISLLRQATALTIALSDENRGEDPEDMKFVLTGKKVSLDMFVLLLTCNSDLVAWAAEVILRKGKNFILRGYKLEDLYERIIGEGKDGLRLFLVMATTGKTGNCFFFFKKNVLVCEIWSLFDFEWNMFFVVPMRFDEFVYLSIRVGSVVSDERICFLLKHVKTANVPVNFVSHVFVCVFGGDKIMFV